MKVRYVVLERDTKRGTLAQVYEEGNLDKAQAKADLYTKMAKEHNAAESLAVEADPKHVPDYKPEVHLVVETDVTWPKSVNH